MSVGRQEGWWEDCLGEEEHQNLCDCSQWHGGGITHFLVAGAMGRDWRIFGKAKYVALQATEAGRPTDAGDADTTGRGRPASCCRACKWFGAHLGGVGRGVPNDCPVLCKNQRI